MRNPSSLLSALIANYIHHDHLLKSVNIYYVPMIHPQHLAQCLTQRRMTEGGVFQDQERLRHTQIIVMQGAVLSLSSNVWGGFSPHHQAIP